jgi:hypothetical protein
MDIGYHSTTDTIGYLKIVGKGTRIVVEWGLTGKLRIETITFPEKYKNINLIGCLHHNECTL